MRSLASRVAVVTGASGGLGRATAIALAEEGMLVACAARRLEALEETAHLARARGGDAIAIACDVTKEREVEALKDAVLAKWGRIDAWVQAAAVTLFAPTCVGPFADHRRVIETNVFGAMLCARAALPVFRRQGHGVLVEISSILGRVGQPFVPAYAVSKFAVRGLSESLRIELADAPDIHVCTVYPYAIDTPHFESGANRVRRRAHAMPPVQSPEEVAAAIVDLVRRPRREVFVPRSARLWLALRALMPGAADRAILHALEKWHFSEATEPPSAGNLYAPRESEGHVHGHRPPRVAAAKLALSLARDAFAALTGAAERGPSQPEPMPESGNGPPELAPRRAA